MTKAKDKPAGDKIPDDTTAQTIRELAGRFAASLPNEARMNGRYAPQPGDGLGDDKVDVPDGSYRVVGSDWILVLSKGRLREVFRAVAPNFGGARVIAVPGR